MDMQDLIGIATVLVVSFILIATFFLVSEQLKGIHAESDYKAAVITMNDLVIGNNSATTGNVPPRLLPYGGTIEAFCKDATSDYAIPIANITFVNSNSPETPSTASVALSNITVNCTFNATDFATTTWQSLNKSEIAMGEFADWGDTLVVAAMAALILSLVLGAIMIGNSRKGVM